jgi:hypothetical protein
LCPKYAKIHPHEYVIFKNFPGLNPGWTPVNKRKGRGNRGGTEVKGLEERKMRPPGLFNTLKAYKNLMGILLTTQGEMLGFVANFCS